MASRRAPKQSKMDPAPAKDALEQAILAALDGHLDPDLFEKCAAELLSTEYPSLTPVRGGSDGGFDGEFWTDNPQPNPLVTTTGRDLRGNLKKNLEQALRRGRFTEAVFATSRPASPQQRKGLRELAESLGVTKLAIHEKDWFASRLYRAPAWCQKLLGVTGRPSALARDVGRPQARQFASELVGRDGVVAALESSPGDLILVGGPGIGKTSVLRELNTRVNGYFAVDADRTALADAIRSKVPSIVVVDDAGMSVDLLRSVLLVRGQVGAQFRVIASCWTSHKEDVASAFDDVAPDVIALGLLPADTIVQIVNAVGVREPIELVRRIVRQAEGRPGLATTLAHAALNRDVQEVVNGNALLQYLAPTLKRHLESDTTRLLGCFGLGGKRGMPIPLVADHLRRPRDEVTEVLTNLSAAGVIRIGRGLVSVWPEELRVALVAKTFFSDPGLPYKELAEQAPSQVDLLATVVGAKWAGGRIPELSSMVERCNDPRVWSLFASLGAQESRHALKCRPDLLDALAPIALPHIADEVLPLLFDQASNSKDIPRLVDAIEEWARKVDGAELMVQRSQTLVDSAAHWLNKRRDSNVAIAAACVAMNPQFSTTESDPGLGMTVRFSQGMLVREALAAIEALWPHFLRMLETGPALPWRAVLDAVDAWCSVTPMVSLDDTTESCRRDAARRMIRDLIQVAGAQNAVKRRLRQLARMVNLQLAIDGDEAFEILYPYETETDWENWEAANERHATAAKNLAVHWANEPATEVARRLLGFASQVADVDSRMGSVLGVFANELATHSPSPREVLDTFVRSGLDAAVVWPLAKQCADQDRASTVGLLLTFPAYVQIALDMAIMAKPFDRAMMDQCIRANPDAASALSIWVLRLDSLDLLRYLLEHEDQDIAVTAALGLCQRQKHEVWLDHLKVAWEIAFLQSATAELRHNSEFWIDRILRKNKHLAFPWLKRLMNAKRQCNDSAVLAARLLGQDERVEALSAMPAMICYRKVLVALVGGDPERFRHLLSLTHLRIMHLSPLQGHPNETWMTLVPVALESGYSEREVAAATLPTSWSWSGKQSDMWRGWLDSVSRYLHHEDRSICRIAGVITADIEKCYAEALEREHREQIYGIGEDD